MRLIFDFSTAQISRLVIVPRWVLLGISLVTLAVLVVLVYLTAHLLAAYWINSGAPIAQEIAKREINAENEDRRRLWLESVGILEQDLAYLNARVIELYRKGAVMANKVDLPGDEMFPIDGIGIGADVRADAAEGDTSLLCNSNDSVSLEVQQIHINDKVHRLIEHLSTLEKKFDALQQQSIRTAVQKQTVPVERPVIGRNWLSSRFGYRRDPFSGRRAFHAGYDYAARTGTPITAGAAGIVSYAGRLGNYGNAVRIEHGDDIATMYGHMHKIYVEQGQYVSQGDIIGTIGSTGRSTGPHLHYEVRINNRPRPIRKTLNELRAQRGISS